MYNLPAVRFSVRLAAALTFRLSLLELAPAGHIGMRTVSLVMNELAIQLNVPLGTYTTLRIGGPAEYFVMVHSEDELKEAVAWAKAHTRPITVLGEGSNVLIADEGIKGLVIKNEIGGISTKETEDKVHVTAGAGVHWDELVADTVARGLWGFENLSGIPGTAGATPVQNVGAYGVEVSERIAVVRVYDIQTETCKELTLAECMFAYRDSVFKHEEGKRYIVVAVTYVLHRQPSPNLTYKDLSEYFSERKPTLENIRRAVIEIRKGKFPDLRKVGTAGSFFKNPVISRAKFEELRARYATLPGFDTKDGVKIPLGYVLDRVLGLRGMQEGDVGTYEHQALVLVNHGNASAREVEAFAGNIERKVFEATGIRIEREVRSLH